MLSITLLPHDEYRWKGENPSPATFPREKGIYPLYHQWRTYHAEQPIIVNTYNTGTGKTKGALLRLVKRVRQKGTENLNPTEDNVLFIVPTNELIRQHVKDAQDFCDENELPYRVVPITKEWLDTYGARPHTSEGQLRRPYLLHSILNDASLIDENTEKKATIFVVNPDIFYYAIYWCYNRFDRGSLFVDFFGGFNYIIIDELHYYTPRQLAAFLFCIKFSIERGYVSSPSTQRQFCLLTATPRPQVKQYLITLGAGIDWIEPDTRSSGEVFPQDIEPVCALSEVELRVYSTEELREGEQSGGLLELIRQERSTISNWLHTSHDGYRMEGAIISSSLGMISRIRQQLLAVIPEDLIGRITGPEDQAGRGAARDKPLILATPTVDLGYNFTRSYDKPRQTIDFLFLDAYSGDELIQRIGRAGRILALREEDKHHPSVVYAVVDPACYELLRPFDGKTLERARLAELSQEMAQKHDLYAYLKTGALAELFRPLMFLKQGMSGQDGVEFDRFLGDLQRFFAGEQSQRQRLFTSQHIRAIVHTFETRQQDYSKLRAIPPEAFTMLERHLDGVAVDWEKNAMLKVCIEAFESRLQKALQEREDIGRTAPEIVAWLQKDLSLYFKEKARMSFRESFQPPLALVSDPEKLHSGKEVTAYSALHFLRYYDAVFYDTQEEWERKTGQSAEGIDIGDVLTYCHLRKLLDAPLRIGLKLDARTFSRAQWEESYAYQVTALYGLEIVSITDQGRLKRSVQDLLRSHFVPAFVAEQGSRSHMETLQLRRRARFYSLPLEVTFADGSHRRYAAILGTMAFLVCAEMPPWMLRKAHLETQGEDDSPIIC